MRRDEFPIVDKYVQKQVNEVLDKIKAEIEPLPTKTRTNWDGCCPDAEYPEIEYVDVTKNKLLSIIDKYKAESEDEGNAE